MRNLLLTMISIVATSVGCSKPNNPTVSQETSPIQLVLELDPATVELPPAPLGSIPINVGFFLSVPIDSVSIYPSEQEAAKAISLLLGTPITVLQQCNMHLVVEVAQVIALPEHLLRIQGNEVGSWGGHPPEEITNTEAFTYEQNERLTEDTRTLFRYGKRFTSPRTVAIFTVEKIIYYVGQQREGAGGLSFPPNAFHHPDDYPYRNSVLVGRGAQALVTDQTPLTTFISLTVAHELGRMFLNVSDHSKNEANLTLFARAYQGDEGSRRS